MKINTSLTYKIFMLCNYIFLITLSLTMLFPYINVLAKAFNDGVDASRGGITILPRVFTLDNFKTVFSGVTFKSSVIISVARVVTGVLFALIVQFGAAYALTKKRFFGKRFILAMFMIPMFLQAGQIPTYVLFSNLKLLNNFWVYILPVLFNFYNVVIIRTFIQSTIPDSLEESAFIDGANEVTIFVRIIVPLCKPILATIALWVMVYHWNDWTTTLLYIKKPALYTLQYTMMELVKESERVQKMLAAAIEMGQFVEDASVPTSESVTAAQIIITTVPIICVYPFLQKYFVKGIMLGSVKG